MMVVPSQQIKIGPICLPFRKPDGAALETQVFLSIVEDLFDLLADRKSIIMFDGYVAGVEDGMNILP